MLTKLYQDVYGVCDASHGAELAAAVAALPDSITNVIYDHYVLQKSIAEMAEAYGVHPAVVERKLVVGVGLLRVWVGN